MSGMPIRLLVGVLCLLFTAGRATADTVQLQNGDTLRGDVTSLDENEMKLSSESFGELTIPRDKIEAIYLGDARPPVAVGPSQQAPTKFSGDMPSLQNPQLRQMYDSLLGNMLGEDANTQEIQQNFRQAREQLKSLQEGMAPSEQRALQGYIDLFSLLAPPQHSSGSSSASQRAGGTPSEEKGASSTETSGPDDSDQQPEEEDAPH